MGRLLITISFYLADGIVYFCYYLNSFCLISIYPATTNIYLLHRKIGRDIFLLHLKFHRRPQISTCFIYYKIFSFLFKLPTISFLLLFENILNRPKPAYHSATIYELISNLLQIKCLTCIYPAKLVYLI